MNSIHRPGGRLRSALLRRVEFEFVVLEAKLIFSRFGRRIIDDLLNIKSGAIQHLKNKN